MWFVLILFTVQVVKTQAVIFSYELIAIISLQVDETSPAEVFDETMLVPANVLNAFFLTNLCKSLYLIAIC